MAGTKPEVSGHCNNREIVTEFLKRLSSQEPLSALELMTDSCTWWTIGSTALSGLRRRDEFVKALGGIAAVLTGPLQIEPLAFTSEGDRFAVEAESHGQHKDGRQYNNNYHFLFELHDGKIDKVREYFDSMHANDVLCS